MAKVAEAIEKNAECFRAFTKAGLIPASVVRQHQIYNYYQTTNGGKMQRYQDTAEAMKTHVNTVMSAVKEMQKPI